MYRMVRVLTLMAVVTSVAVVGAAQRSSRQIARDLTTYKEATCGCCGKWVEYMKWHGFVTTVHDMADTAPIKDQKGVPPALRSCHTAVVGGYVIEGHVPVEDVERLLRERPAVVGLAVPGMPPGSPGMDIPNSPAYDVVSFDKAGRTKVFATHGAPARGR